MSPHDTTEDFWAWALACPLDRTFYGQIILTVRAGQVEEVEQRQTHRRPRQQPGHDPGGDRPKKPAPHEQ